MGKKTLPKIILTPLDSKHLARLSSSSEETEKIGKSFAEKIIRKNLRSNLPRPFEKGRGECKFAKILSLEGELGAGKTTFLKGFALGLGIKDMIKSPTFVIMRRHPIKRKAKSEKCKTTDKNSRFRYFYHFDCYRVERPKEIIELGWQKIIFNPENIVAVEWGDKIKKILPKNCIKIKFKIKGREERDIEIQNL